MSFSTDIEIGLRSLRVSVNRIRFVYSERCAYLPSNNAHAFLELWDFLINSEDLYSEAETLRWIQARPGSDSFPRTTFPV